VGDGLTVADHREEYEAMAPAAGLRSPATKT
jgi:hypothetical protein